MNTLQISISLSVLNNRFDDQTTKNNCFLLQVSPPRDYKSVRRGKTGYHSRVFSRKLSFFGESTGKFQILKKKRCFDLSFFGPPRGKAQILKKKRSVAVRVNQGFDFNGGNGRKNSNNARILGNLALAIGLTYLSMTGQLGWILDAIVSIWINFLFVLPLLLRAATFLLIYQSTSIPTNFQIFAVLLPIAGIGAFLWYAGRDIIQGSFKTWLLEGMLCHRIKVRRMKGRTIRWKKCPNCGNDFQILKSSLKDGAQLCPFCSQPFSVQGKDFIRESAKFSTNQSSTFGQAFNGFSTRGSSERVSTGKSSSATVVDIEAEVKDVE